MVARPMTQYEGNVHEGSLVAEGRHWVARANITITYKSATRPFGSGWSVHGHRTMHSEGAARPSPIAMGGDEQYNTPFTSVFPSESYIHICWDVGAGLRMSHVTTRQHALSRHPATSQMFSMIAAKLRWQIPHVSRSRKKEEHVLTNGNDQVGDQYEMCAHYADKI